MKGKEFAQHFEELGFSTNDAAVYAALLKVGQSTAGPLITETNLHRNVVYTSLAHLIVKKLVNEKTVKGKKFFSLSSPDVLNEQFAKKVEVAKEVADYIKSNLNSEAQEISIHQGNEEYGNLLISLLKALPKGGEQFVLGTGGEEFMENTMKVIWKKYHDVAHERKITVRMLGYELQRKAMEAALVKEGIYETRYLPSDTENPAGIHIYPELGIVLNIIYSDDKNPVTAIKSGYLQFI